MMRKLLLFLFILILALALPASFVLAIAEPDSSPQVSAIYVYEDLLEDGDTGVLIDYYIDYDFTAPITGTPVPAETVTEAYLAIFVGADGTTQLKAVAPYTYVNSGYGRGLAWIYFSAAEVSTYNISSTNSTNYRIWLIGNPSLSWTLADNITPCDPPKTIVSIDQWNTTGDMAVLLALRVLYYADVLELAWGYNMIEATSLGNRLTTIGASYFENVITGLRAMAPSAFSSGTVEPTLETIDYTTGFGAIATSTLLAGSPVTLTEGTNALNPTGAGTITFTLSQGTSGNVTGATVTGTPLALKARTNTATITGAGAITVVVNLVDTTTGIGGSVTGTGWDLTAIATVFGISRWMFSGIVWLIMSVVIMAAVFRASPDQYGGASAGKILFPVFVVCIIGGTLLGLLKPIVGILMFICIAGFFIGYILFFRGANA